MQGILQPSGVIFYLVFTYAFLFAAVRGRQYVHVSLGVLAGTPSRLPDHHIYVGSKASWFEIHDSWPQDEAAPPR